MLGETEKSSDLCRTASLSEMGHEQRAATSSTVTYQMHCIQMAKDIVKLLSRPGSPIILVLALSVGTQFQGYLRPFSRGAKYTGWRNFAIFDWSRRLSRKRYEIGPSLLWNINTLIRGGSICVNSHDLQWSLTRVSRSLYTYKSNISKTVRFRDKVTIKH